VARHDRARLRHELAEIRATLHDVSAAAPTHADFIARHCAADTAVAAR